MQFKNTRKQINVPLKKLPTYNIHNQFNPGNTVSPWSGFASNINIETELRNQVYALQKCSQSVYVPNSKSDLYTCNLKPLKQTTHHELLFKTDNFSQFDPNPDNNIIGYEIFNNNTRCQVRDMTKQQSKC